MNIIVVHNGQIVKSFMNEPEELIVIESGTFRETTMRTITPQKIRDAEGHKEIELAGGYIARYRELYAKSALSSYLIGNDRSESSLGDGVDMFSAFGHPVKAGTLLFQANLLAFLESVEDDPEKKEAFGL
jgi:hypothetical protein